MKKRTTKNRFSRILILNLIFACSLILSGCGDLFNFDDFFSDDSEPSSVIVSGTVTNSSDGKPLSFANIHLTKRSSQEDWEFGGYDYEHIKSIQADTNGSYQLYHSLTGCGKWVYLMDASKSTDLLRYYSKDYKIRCRGGSQTINISVLSIKISQ